MTTSSRSSSGPRLDNRCSRLLLPAVQFRFQATSGDASGLKAVKPEVCHEEQNTEATAVLPASEPDPSSPKPPDAGLSRRASLGDTFLDPAEDAQQALPPPDDALTPPGDRTRFALLDTRLRQSQSLFMFHVTLMTSLELEAHRPQNFPQKL